MAYRFKVDNDAGKGFRRIAREQIVIVSGELGAYDELPASAIHASRKALKRLRALVAAVTPAIGSKAARKYDGALRDIARRLSARRDADVSLDTVAALEARYGEKAKEVLTPLRHHLDEIREAAHSGLDHAAVYSICRRLQHLSQSIESVAWSGTGFAPVIAGVSQSYESGRIAFKKAFKSPTDDRVHDLRKAVQAHWRHMGLLSRAWPELFAAHATAAHELSQILGDDHDLALLKTAAASLGKDEKDAVIKLCARRQKELRAIAKPRARQLYAETERVFARRMSVYWNVAGKIARSGTRKNLLAGAAAGQDGTQPRIAAKVAD
jgi:CHAD domain-containing protein